MKTNSRKMLMDQDIPRQIKQAIRRRDDYTCIGCGKTSRNPNILSMEVHHIIYASEDISIVQEPNNLITLCSECHRDYHATFDNDEVGRKETQRDLTMIATARRPKYDDGNDIAGANAGKNNAMRDALAALLV